MRDLDYRVMRNPQTLASYRNWLAASAKVGCPFMIAGSACLLVGGLIMGLSLARGGFPILDATPGLLAVGAGVMSLGLWRISRHRRLHPWIDDQA